MRVFIASRSIRSWAGRSAASFSKTASAAVRKALNVNRFDSITKDRALEMARLKRALRCWFNLKAKDIIGDDKDPRKVVLAIRYSSLLRRTLPSWPV